MTPAALETSLRDLAGEIHGASEDGIISPARLHAIALRLNTLAPLVGRLQLGTPARPAPVCDLGAERRRRVLPVEAGR